MLHFHNGRLGLSSSLDSSEEGVKIDKKLGKKFFKNLKRKNFNYCLECVKKNKNFLFAQDEYGKTAMHRLVYEYCSSKLENNEIITVIKKLLNIDWKLMNMHDKFIHTPIYSAFLTRDNIDRINNIAQLFINYAATSNTVILDLHVKNSKESSETVLHIAAREGNTDAVKLILGYDQTTIYSTNKFGSTPLHCAAFYGHEEIIRLFLWYTQYNKGLLDMKDERGYTALHSAAARNRVEIVQLLIANGADCDVLNAKNKTYFDLLQVHNSKAR